MSYGLKYRCEFSSYKNIQYRFDIEQKDYSGGFTTLQASGKPFIQKWATDDPKPIIKGCNVTFNYLNKGSQPLTTFYSEADDTFKGKLTNLTTNETLFVGFLIQDDCSEIQIDYTHEVSLSFNDNLGLLKDVTLDAAFNAWGFLPFEGKQSLATVLFACIYATNIKIPIRIYSNIYETTQTKSWSTFKTTLIDTSTFLKDDTNYESCYNCLEKIFNTLECTLLQSNGRWHVIRWCELRYYGGDNVTCWEWNENFVQVGVSSLGGGIPFGKDGTTYPEFGMYSRIQRPLKSVNEVFNFEQPNGLIRNVSLNNLGTLISESISGNVKTKLYNLPTPSNWRRLNGDTSSIGIDYDNTTGAEIQRYILQPFTRYAAVNQYAACLSFNEVEMAKDDVIDFSFQFKANVNTGVTKRFSIIVNIQRLSGTGSSTNPAFASLTFAGSYGSGVVRWNNFSFGYANQYPTSGEPPGNEYILPVDDNIANWQSFSLLDAVKAFTGNDSATFPKMPFDGLLKIYIVGWNATGNSTNKVGYIKGLKFDVKYKINDTINVVGQNHNQLQPKEIKNISDTSIKIDDSPRNSISGTLFIPQLTGILYTRTKQWQQENAAKIATLSAIVVFDKLFQKRIPRTILEGSLFGLIFDGVSTISALSVLTSPQYPALYFVSGNLEIDYRSDKITGTWYELYKFGEIDADLGSNYLFTYLYQNK
jgi:hypothetical protein